MLQRVGRASVTVGSEQVASIARGYVLLVGIGVRDAGDEVERMASKIANLRVFPDHGGRTNLALADVEGEILVVPQFTLFADVRKGRRPSWTGAAAPDVASERVEAFARSLEGRGFAVRRGIFGAHMDVELLNDGPFTLILDADLI